MLTAAIAGRGMVTAPHHLAAEAGLSVLRDGGNAIEAMVAAAATIAVVYPHMNSIGGDGFWLIYAPGETPVAIDACGPAGAKVEPGIYGGAAAIPARGGLAANTVAGAIDGWREALTVSVQWGGRLPLSRLLEDATHYARNGFPASGNQSRTTAAKQDDLRDVLGFADCYLVDGAAPEAGALFRNTRLADTLDTLATDGLESFYRGNLAEQIASDLAAAGSPLGREDLATFAARRVTPLSVGLKAGRVYNLPPPTQGLASLMILALFDRLAITEPDGFAHIHGLVEATKRAFLVRDAEITDPAYMDTDPTAFLSDSAIDRRAASIDPAHAMPWPQPQSGGDTVWLGAADGAGRMVSYIQSVYWEFGSGVVLDRTGVTWQNRGSSFALDPRARNALAPGRRPFHTLNPPLAVLDDGRVMAYGTMGGEGQPQTQAAVFTRHVVYDQNLQEAITAPRWLLGRTWGEESTSLKLESRVDPAVIESLAAAGHAVEVIEPFSDLMGHAGAVVCHPGGWIEGASDPRSDGRPAGF